MRSNAQDGTGGHTTNTFKFDCGMAVVTCSSQSLLNNWVPCGNGPSDLSPNAFVVGIIDTRNPVGVGAPYGSSGGGWAPAMWHNEASVTNRWNARHLGEVFGIALDDATPPNIYVTATSIYYGTGRGPGGHGGVYKLSGSNFGISVFQTFAASSSPVGSVSLGNICFDREHRQFFVTDLDHGWIRRLDMSGTELSTGGTPYDHGVTGNANVPAPAVPDVSSAPGDLTRSGRRVFGIQVYQSRLYYSVWFAPSSPNPGINEVWSVGIQANGDLIPAGPSGPRREFIVNGLPTFNQYPTAEPAITDIAFSESGRMVVGERSICTGSPTDLASGSHAARALEYTLSGTVWTPINMLNVGAIVNTSRVNSAGGVDYDCEGHAFVTGDALINDGSIFPHPNDAVYGLQIFPTPTSVVTNSWVIDFDGSLSIYDKLSVGDVEVVRCCDCIRFTDEQVQCLATNTFQWSFCVTNTGTLTNGHLVFIDLPAGVTVSPQIIDIVPGIAPGKGFCTNVTITINPSKVTNELCFRIAAHTPDYSQCCIVTKCIRTPDCCAIISGESVKCDPATGTVTWCHNLKNLSGVPVKYVVLVPDPSGCASIGQGVITFNPPLPHGASTNLCVTITATNSPCDTACIRFVLADVNFRDCCTFVRCVDLRCKKDNRPPILDCPQGATLCDTNEARGFVIKAVISDPDGDPIVAIWKVNGVPVLTNNIPGGVSSSPTPIQLTGNHSPGTHVVTLCVSDGNGPARICDIPLQVGDPNPPMITCPPGRVIESWEFQIPNLIPQIVVKDDCTKTNQIKVTQQPPAGTIIGPGRTCITFTATDLAGNVATCTTCIDVIPLRLVATGGTGGVLDAQLARAPAEFGLSVEGTVSGVESVEYFANGVSLGRGTGPNFRHPWNRVPEGNYFVNAEARRQGAGRALLRSLTISVLPPATTSGPAFTAITASNDRIVLSMTAPAGEKCVIESAAKLDSAEWQIIETTIGDGHIHQMEIPAGNATLFFRIRRPE